MDTAYVELEDWYAVLTHPCFKKVTEHLQARMNKIQLEIEKLGRTPSWDNSVKIACFVATKNELNAALAFFKFKEIEKVKLDNKIKLESIKQS